MSPTTTMTSGEDTMRLYQTRTPPSRGSELLLRIACAAMGGLLLLLGLVATTDVLAPADRIWPPVIGLSAVMAVCAFLGTTRAEHNKTRAAQEVLTASVREEMRRNNGQVEARLESLTGAVMDLVANTRTAMDRASREREAGKERLSELETAIRQLSAVLAHAPSRGEVEKLGEQVETLADMVSNPDRVILAMPEAEVYEMGRQAGIEEERRKSA